MRAFRHMHLEVFRHEDGEGRIAIYASEPTVGDLYTPLNAGTGYEYPDAGLCGLSMYFSEEEFFGLLDGTRDTHSDVYHYVRRFCELYTFFDMETPAGERGVARVRFVNLTIPFYVARILKRAVRMTLARCERGGERLDVNLPWATRDRWLRQYGQATGKVAFEISDREYFDACKAVGGETFERCIEGLYRIAHNGTYRHTETGRVVLVKDWGGFYFRILRPDGRCSMNGGVINHGRDGKQDWSTHT